MSPSPAVIPEVVERRMSDRRRNSSGFRDRSSSFQGGERRPSSVLQERIQVCRTEERVNKKVDSVPKLLICK